MFTTWRFQCLWMLAPCALVIGAWAAEKEAAPQKSITVDLGGGVKMDLVLIPAGSFLMGSEKGERFEKPVHEVKIPKPFHMGKYEVTQEQWQAVMGSNPSDVKRPKNPVNSVSWDDCQAFLKKLDERVRRGRFTLPTEAEWEYACRAGSKTAFCFGDDEKQLAEYAWYGANCEGKAHPVGQKKPNAWGLYDMQGNVHEWCEDVFHPSYEGAASDGSAWVVRKKRDSRVMRGGAWYNYAKNCRSATRPGGRTGGGGWAYLGCRVVLRDF